MRLGVVIVALATGAIVQGCSVACEASSCQATLRVTYTLAREVEFPLEVAFCDGATCGSMTVEAPLTCDEDPVGATMLEGPFVACLREGSELHIGQQVWLEDPRNPPENSTVQITVSGRAGMLLDETGVPVESSEDHCSGYPCWRRNLDL